MSSWFSGSSLVGPSRNHRTSHSSPRGAFVRPHSPSASSSRGAFVRPHSPAASSSRGYFSRPHQSSSSYYKRRPRDGFIARMIYQLRKLVRNLIEYAKRHPVKIIMLVAMPLITGGALNGLLKTVGISLPAGLGASFGGRGGMRDAFGGSAGAGGGNIETVMNIAKMFM